MTFDIITLFPDMFSGPFSMSMIKRGIDNSLIEMNFHHLRDYASDKHKTVDDTPYGGGKGLVLKVDVMDKAITSVRELRKKAKLSRVVLMTPKGTTFNQEKAIEFSKLDNLVLICGHYEGFDERIRSLVDEEISIGNFVLTGGEIAAMAICDATARLIPGVLSEESPDVESFMTKDENGNYLLEYPQYTKPPLYHEMAVPEILLSGNHGEIEKWRKANSKISHE